jgi:predicted anti-sigma-YlaC factor YlaD
MAGPNVRLFPSTGAVTAILIIGAMTTACSVRRIAINNLSDALAASGSTFATDDDPELIRAALPFSLKLIESLLAENPRHRGLLAAAAAGFTQFGFAFVQQDAEEIEDRDLDAATAGRVRAKRLYLRARDYGLRGLEAGHPAFAQELRANPRAAVKAATAGDAPLLYWTAVSWSAAISVSKDDAGLIGDLPVVEALIDRAREVNESYDNGAIHTFLITYEMGRPGGTGDPAARAREHFDRAMKLTGGLLASPLVAFAESVAVYGQDRAGFERLLKQALAIDPGARPEWRLSNLIYQRRARWLLGRTDRLILE